MNDPDAPVREGAVPLTRRKGLYILPNAISLAALFAAFYAIVMAMNGRFEAAVFGIFASAVLDSLDGRVARMTHSQSAFGEQMDSLCDMVSFGAALRLARFNTNIGIVDRRYFQGLPSPAAAALVMGLIWVADDAGVRGVTKIDWLAWTAFAVTLYAGLTMVTNAPFYSFKDLSFKRSVPFIVIVAIALGIAVINIHPPIVLFALFCAYGLSGYAVYAYKKAKGKPVSVIATSTDEPEEAGLHR
jgi:CDP-diacylglycerol---serine O-phosphatidyltransferase